MKQFLCGDVVPGCTAKFEGANNEEILGQVAGHAKTAHGITEVPAELVDQVLAKIEDID